MNGESDEKEGRKEGREEGNDFQEGKKRHPSGVFFITQNLTKNFMDCKKGREEGKTLWRQDPRRGP